MLNETDGEVSPGPSTFHSMQPLRDLITRIRTRSPRRATTGRLADVHMWTIRDGWTSRAQAFRDETGRTFAVITRRAGDTGPGHINGAEMFRADAWAQFFPAEQARHQSWSPTSLIPSSSSRTPRRS